MKNQSLIFLLAFGILISQATFADIWRVNNNPLYTQDCDHCFSQLQDAVNSPLVSPGDTIHLEASGIAYAGVEIDKQLVIIGTGYFLDENGVLQQNQQGCVFGDGIKFLPGSDGSLLTGVAIDCFNWAIQIDENNLTIKRCYLENRIVFNNTDGDPINNVSIMQCYINNTIEASANSGSGPVYNLLISNCYIEDIDLEGGWQTGTNIYEGSFTQNIVLDNASGSNGIDYYNNIFIDNFIQDDNSESNVFNNIFTNEVPDWLSGSSNIYVPEGTVFVATGSTDGIFQVNPSNICPECYEGYDPGGPNTIEIGMFGGNTPYVLSGIPNIPTVYDLHSNTHVYQDDTTHVTISTRSNQ